MTTLEITKNYLEQRGAFTPTIHEVVNVTSQTIGGDIPEHLKLSITLSELITLTSHLRKNIQLSDGTIVPCNAISIALAASGVSKDSSMNKVRRALQPAYEVIAQRRKQLARQAAEQAALDDGQSSEEWLNYYEAPPALQVGLGTPEGLVKNFAMLEESPLGAASINSSEVGSEMQTNQSFLDIVKTISIGYDLGKVPIKVVKAAENRVGAIEHLPINALMFGSEDAILYDNFIKAKFRLMFNTQLARRSLFSFSKQRPVPRVYKSEKELLRYHELQRTNSKTARSNIENYLVDMVEFTTTTPLTLSKEAQAAFDMYLEYNDNLSHDISPQLPITKLSRKHKQWLALKLSGNYAILDGEQEISEENYILAINTVEELAPDLETFEKELNKELYEQFVDYCRLHIGSDDKLSLSIHELKKLGYLPATNNYQAKLDELLTLTSSYDAEGIYTRCDDGVCYEPIIKDSECGLSLLSFTKHEAESPAELKQRMAKSCSSGYEFYETPFEALADVLSQYAAYSPFLFKNGKRSKDNLAGKTKWIVLDIDNSNITYEECHLLLSDYNHHIATTSDASNEFKFRVLLELDSLVDIPAENWKYFIESIANALGLNADLLPKSQIYFSYASDNILSVTDAEPIEAKQHVINASNHTKPEQPATLSAKAKTAALKDPRETFAYAYECTDNGSVNLYKAAKHAHDLGASKEEIINLVWDINSYWTVSMDPERIQQTIISQVSRWQYK